MNTKKQNSFLWLWLIKTHFAALIALMLIFGEPIMLLARPMTSGADSGSGQTTVTSRGNVGADCEEALNYELYPIALHVTTIQGKTPGQTLSDIFNGAGTGQFGWLSWTGVVNSPALEQSLVIPGNSWTYDVNPQNPTDHMLSIGDWVLGSTGVKNSSSVRDALDKLINYPMAVPLWDQATGNGGNLKYRVAGFALVKMTGYQLPGTNKISAVYLGNLPALTDWAPAVISKIYKTSEQGPNGFQDNFSASAGSYVLIVKNGQNGLNMVTDATITLNGQYVVTPNDFTQPVTLIKKHISLFSANQLQVRLNGSPDSFILVSIYPPCDNHPPVIT